MRKNKMMRTASGLLVATLLTTSIISGTFAKYATEASGSDTARVAKWGVTVSASGNLFGTDYASNSADADKNSIVASSKNVSTAQGSTRDNIVAPGTKNEEGYKILISGTPEVAYSITADANNVTAKDIFLAKGEYGVMVEATGLNAETDVSDYYTENEGTYSKATAPWVSNKKYYKLTDIATVSAEKYYPLTWSVAHTGIATDVNLTSDLTAIQQKMIEGIAKNSREANASADASYTLTWSWKFEQSADAADTILGDLKAGMTDRTVVKKNTDTDTYTKNLINGTDYNLDVAFGMKVTVTQEN